MFDKYSNTIYGYYFKKYFKFNQKEDLIKKMTKSIFYWKTFEKHLSVLTIIFSEKKKLVISYVYWI